MKSILIADTTREEREQIVAESIGNIEGLCDGCSPGLIEMYQAYIDGRKERYSDDSLRPALDLGDRHEEYLNNPYTKLIAALGKIHSERKDDLVWGDYRQLHLTTQQYAFARGKLIVAVNNSDGEGWFNVEAQAPAYIGLLSGRRIESSGGRLNFSLPGCGGDIFAPDDGQEKPGKPVISVEPAPAKPENKPEAEAPAVKNDGPKAAAPAKETAPSGPAPEKAAAEPRPEDVKIPDLPYDQMTVEQLQAVVLDKMAKNGPVTEQMRRSVLENIWHNSLVNWAKSFR